MRHRGAVESMTLPGLAAPPLSALHTIQDQLHTSTVRMHALVMGHAHGLDAEAVERLGIVVNGLAGNIAQYAGAGHIILRPVGEYATGCIEVLAIDKGPGIADMNRAMRDGSLAVIRRLVALFDIYSQVGRGTAVLVHIAAKSAPDATCRCAGPLLRGCVGVVCVPLSGEAECGDTWAVEAVAGRVTAVLVDGLGHGPEAASAAHAALAEFRMVTSKVPEFMVNSIHAAIHDTRGAALSVAVIDQTRRTTHFCGVGNVEGRVVNVEGSRQLIPQNGIVGHTMPRVQAADVPWPEDGRLIMHSDGISSRWRLELYPGLLARHPAVVAGVLFRDFARARDDATVLVIRECPAAA